MRHRACSTLLASLLSLYGGCVLAMIPDWPQAGWVWEQEQSADLSGIHVFQRELSAPIEPAEVARVLAVRLPQFDRLMVLDGQILLSGLDQTHHWLARVGRDAQGARAMISAMTVGASTVQRSEFDPALYVPGDMQPQFSHAQTLGGQRVVQVLYESSRNRLGLILQVRRALLQAGWRNEDIVPGEGAQHWQRIGERLYIRIYERTRGSVLWMQHQGGGQP